jgi:hypothetical protein
MKYFLALTFLSLVSCGQSINSNTSDFLLSGNGIDPSNTKLLNAFEVINDKCISCHTGYHNSWSSLNTDQLWIDSGNVTAGTSLSSPLIIRLKNRGGDMPLLSPMLTETDYNYLINWIDSL